MLGFVALFVFVSSWMLVASGYPGGKFKRNLMGFCAGVASMIPYAAVISIYTAVMSEKHPEPAKPPVVTVARLMWQEYAENEVAAAQKFRGNVVKIAGIVQRVGEENGEMAVLLEGVSVRTSVIAFLDLAQESKAAAIRRGDAVALRCVGGKVVNGSPSLRDCKIVG